MGVALVGTYNQYDYQGGRSLFSANDTTHGYVLTVRAGTPSRVSTYDTDPVGPAHTMLAKVVATFWLQAHALPALTSYEFMQQHAAEVYFVLFFSLFSFQEAATGGMLHSCRTSPVGSGPGTGLSSAEPSGAGPRGSVSVTTFLTGSNSCELGHGLLGQSGHFGYLSP